MAQHGFITVASGRMVDVLNLQSTDVDITDIAKALSKLCRFGGHTREFYSVAQHSIRVAMALPPELMLEGLLHDAAEAYLVDLPRPLKRALPEYSIIEGMVHQAIAFRFGFPATIRAEVKEADESALLAEFLELMPMAPQGPFTEEELRRAWFPGVKELPRAHIFMTPKEAEGAFLIAYANAVAAKFGTMAPPSGLVA